MMHSSADQNLGDGPTQNDLGELCVRFLNERDTLRTAIIRQKRSLAELAQSNRDISDKDEAAQYAQNSSVTAEQIDVNTSRLRQVESALQRLEQGTYGMCADCGQPIEAKRLRALPMAIKCLGCKEAGETLSTRRGIAVPR